MKATDINQQIDILGTTYHICFKDEDECPELSDFAGLTDFHEKEITINKTYKNRNVKETIRHEIIHAILFESGLQENSSWAFEEEAVDWIALQYPKLKKLFSSLNIEQD